MTQHFTADGFEVTQGGTYWDNGLHLVTVTKVASFSEENRNPDNGPIGALTWWHDTTGGMADGSRLAKRHPFTGELAQPDHTARLEYLRGEIKAECISWGELAELQSLAEHIDPGDVELLEWAGIPENTELPHNTAENYQDGPCGDH